MSLKPKLNARAYRVIIPGHVTRYFTHPANALGCVMVYSKESPRVLGIKIEGCLGDKWITIAEDREGKTDVDWMKEFYARKD